MPKVSIIIPFNNVEAYIEECLKSVVNQTLSDIEIILVNDASRDSSVEIVKKFVEKDKRIKLIELEEQKGQGYARNRALEIASGEYIGFVDSDDFIRYDMFETLYNNASVKNTDITMCQASEYDDITGRYIESDYYSLSVLSKFAADVFSARDSKAEVSDINVVIWNKIYKKEYLDKIGEKFPEGFIYEDLPFFFGTYLPAERISIVWKKLYFYRINRKNSTMRQFNNKILDRPYMVSLTFEKIKKTNYMKDLIKQIQGWIINDLFHRYTLLEEHYHKEFFFLMKQVFQNLDIENPEDTYWKTVYHFEGYLLVLNNSFENFNQKIFNEYLDIHKVEDRLRSQITDRTEIDAKIALIYSDIDKNYDYTNKIRDDINSRAETIKNILLEKESAIYKNIESLQNKIKKTEEETKGGLEGIRQQNLADISALRENNKTEFDKVLSNTDEKISKVYEEITKSYEYTNNLTRNLNNDIKDLSFIVHDNNLVMKNEVDNLSLILSDSNKNFEEFCEKTNSVLFEIREDFKNKFAAKQKEYNDVIFKIKCDSDAKINELSKEFEDYRTQTADLINALGGGILELSEKAEKQKEEIIILKEQIAVMEKNAAELSKPALKKIIDKCLKRDGRE